MGKEISYNNGTFTLTVQDIQHGRGKLTVTMNQPFSIWVGNDDFMEFLQKFGEKAKDIEYNYYLRQLIKEDLKRSEDPQPEQVEPKEVEHETV